MTFTARIAGVATLALAVLPVAALSAAHAAEYPPASVRIADLNLASPTGKAAFDARVGAAAHHYCNDERKLGLKAACEAGVRTEMNEKAQAQIRLASRI
jgi:UrcA family protein